MDLVLLSIWNTFIACFLKRLENLILIEFGYVNVPNMDTTIRGIGSVIYIYNSFGLPSVFIRIFPWSGTNTILNIMLPRFKRIRHTIPK